MKFDSELAQQAFESLKLYADILYKDSDNYQRLAAFGLAVRIASQIQIEHLASAFPEKRTLSTFERWRPAFAAMEPIKMSLFNRAVNEFCSCGGRGPLDPKSCDVCKVYHYVEQAQDHEATSGEVEEDA